MDPEIKSSNFSFPTKHNVIPESEKSLAIGWVSYFTPFKPGFVWPPWN